MIKKSLNYMRPKSGYSNSVYHTLNALLPIIVFFLVISGFAWLGVISVLLAKWRMFAMKPRYWLPNLRANAVDIFFGLSMVVFMAGTGSLYTQVVWTVIYLGWNIWLKPKSNQTAVMAQALVVQLISLVAFYQAFASHSVEVGAIATWVICYVSARHFLGAFSDGNYRQLSAIWAWFGGSMAWILEHWLIAYTSIPQVALVVTIVGYGLAFMYYLYENNRLHNSTKTQLILTMIILLIIIIRLSEWQVTNA